MSLRTPDAFGSGGPALAFGLRAVLQSDLGSDHFLVRAALVSKAVKTTSVFTTDHFALQAPIRTQGDLLVPLHETHCNNGIAYFGYLT